MDDIFFYTLNKETSCSLSQQYEVRTAKVKSRLQISTERPCVIGVSLTSLTQKTSKRAKKTQTNKKQKLGKIHFNLEGRNHLTNKYSLSSCFINNSKTKVLE
jgi:hypothetical protein